MPLTIEQLRPLVGTVFKVRTAGSVIPLRLLEASERPRGGLPERFMTPLSLLLEGPDDVRLAQDNYRLEHAALGEQFWMLVPVCGAGVPPGSYEVLLSQLNGRDG